MDDFRILMDHYLYGADDAILCEARPRIAPLEADKPVILDESIINKEQKPKNSFTNLTSLGHFDGINLAISAVKNCQNINQLIQAVHEFDACPLKHTANQTFFMHGNHQAHYAIITDAPNSDDDKSGQYLSGQSGKLLLQALKSVECDVKSNCYIVPIVFWRPPGGRTPNEGELAMCKVFISKLLQLIPPKKLLLLGKSAQKTFLNNDNIIQNRKIIHELPPELSLNCPVYASFSAEYCMNAPLDKRHLYHDLLQYTGEKNVG